MDLVNIFKNDGNTYQIISQIDQIAMGLEYRKNKDIKLKNKLIESNLKYAFTCANKYTNLIELDEAICLANMALVNCIDTWNPDVACLTTYMTKAIHFEILNHHNKYDNIVKIPKNKKEECVIFKIDDLSLEHYYDEKIDYNDIWKIIEELTNEKEFDMLRKIYNDDELKISDAKIGELYGVSKQRIGQIKNDIKKKLKTNKKLKNIWDEI